MADILERKHQSLSPHSLLHEDDVTVLHLEDFNGELFIHCDVKRWGPQALRHLKELWVDVVLPEVFRRGRRRIWAAADSIKLMWFAKQFGFVMTDFIAEDSFGTARQLMIWEREDASV